MVDEEEDEDDTVEEEGEGEEELLPLAGLLPVGADTAGVVSASLMACMSAMLIPANMPIPPTLEEMAVWMAETVARPFTLELAMSPWQPAHLAV